MVFSSNVFLYLFLPFLFITYFLCYRGKDIFLFHHVFSKYSILFRNILLVLFSLGFYFWGEQWRIYLLLLSLLGNYVFALMLTQKTSNRILGKHSTRTIYQKLIMILCILFNLGLLVYYKYSNFFIQDILGIETWQRVILPIGISFFTFQALSYVIDVYRGDVPATRNIINFACYLTLFSQLIAGPIVRYTDIAPQLKKRHLDRVLIQEGVERFIIGLSKKVLIADTLAQATDTILSADTQMLSALVVWVGFICYALQIFFDFSGYSDMAIGLGRIFGFKFLENFNYPYISKSIKEFWRRWHISLSTWFRDYLYIPLGGSHVSVYRTYINLFIVFILCGFWHGASWNFILWGAYHGFFLTIERIGLGKVLEKTPKFLRHLYALFVILMGWVLFRIENIYDIPSYLKIMFGFTQAQEYFNIRIFLDKDMFLMLVLGIIFSCPLIPFMKKQMRELSVSYKMIFIAIKQVVIISLFLVSIIKIANSSFSPFLYFRF